MPNDPKRAITLKSKAGPLPFTITFDEIEAFRVFEASARKLPDHASPEKAASLAPFREATSPDRFSTSPAVFPPAGALAREALIHFKVTLPQAMKAEFDRLLEAAYISGAVALTEHQRSQSDGNQPVSLPPSALMEPAKAMAHAGVKQLRQRVVVDRPVDNARAIHGKRAGAPSKINYAKVFQTIEAHRRKLVTLNAAIEAYATSESIPFDTANTYYKRGKKQAAAKVQN